MRDYKKLQNGSDIRGVAVATPDGPKVNLGMEEAVRIALGFLLFLMKKTGKASSELTIALGRDPRISGQGLEVAICQSPASKGARVLASGISSTPAMFISTVFHEFKADGSIMLTASHMPFDRNGMKFFTREGGLEKKDISEIISYAESDEAINSITPGGFAMGPDGMPLFGNVESIDLMKTYARHLRQIMIKGLASEDALNPDTSDNAEPQVLSGLRITVDAGNGAGGFFATDVLAPLGADISTSQFLEPDGYFPNHIPNPEDRAAMEAISSQVQKEKTHLGLIFDTDVDRASAVDETGKEIAHNGIVAMAAALIAKDHPGTTVVTDSVTSPELSRFLTETLGLKHLRYKRGYRNVIGKSIDLNKEGIDSQLAIETSGHGAYKDNYFLDDGAYLATLIVIETAKLAKEGKGISSVIASLDEPKEALELRLPFNSRVLEEKGKDFSQAGDEIIAALTDLTRQGQLGSNTVLEEPNYEGVRIRFDDDSIRGWALLRKSLHDPIMPLNIEANKDGGAKAIAETLAKALATYTELEIKKLEEIL